MTRLFDFKEKHVVYFILLSFVSCSSSLGKKDYIHWVKDYKNGLHIQKTVDDFIFDLQYQPSQYILLQQSAGSAAPSSVQAEDNLQHYILTISTRDPNVDFINYGVQDFSAQQRRLYYFSYLFQDDIHIEEDNQVKPCVLFHFERQADLRHSRTFVLAFETPQEKSKEATVVIDSEQFGSLPIKLKVIKENIPALTL